jgi:hypothetical protein
MCRRKLTVAYPIVLCAALFGAVVFESPARAEVTSLPINRCLSSKIASVGKSVSLRVGCLSKDARSGVSDPSCPQKAIQKFTGGSDPSRGAFAKLDARYPIGSETPCLTFADQGAFEAAIASYSASVPIAAGSAPGRCDAAKIRCVGQYVAAVAKCASKAAHNAGAIDLSCINRAQAKLGMTDGATGCLVKAASHPDCSHTCGELDHFRLFHAAQQFVEASLCALDPGNAGCAGPTPASTATPTATPTATETPTPTFTPDGLEPTPTPTSTPLDDTFDDCSISAPLTGAQISGQTTIQASASDSGGVDHVDFLVDATAIGTASAPISGQTYESPAVDTVALTNGPHDLVIQAYDAAGNSCQDTISVTVLNFEDNGDGTVTDHELGLQWEKKTSSVGSGANLADPHDVDNTYSWTEIYTAPDGTAFTDFLNKLNGGFGPCFAGHCDWRLPTEAELQTILAVPHLSAYTQCPVHPCIDEIFGPTVENLYWSSTTYAGANANAWAVGFTNRSVGAHDKNTYLYVRAVRDTF